MQAGRQEAASLCSLTQTHTNTHRAVLLPGEILILPLILHLHAVHAQRDVCCPHPRWGRASALCWRQTKRSQWQTTFRHNSFQPVGIRWTPPSFAQSQWFGQDYLQGGGEAEDGSVEQDVKGGCFVGVCLLCMRVRACSCLTHWSEKPGNSSEPVLTGFLHISYRCVPFLFFSFFNL